MGESFGKRASAAAADALVRLLRVAALARGRCSRVLCASAAGQTM
jgi:hypothetical protein